MFFVGVRDFVFDGGSYRFEFLLACDDGGVWSGIGQDKEERLIRSLFGDEIQGFSGVEFEIVIGSGVEFVAGKDDFFGISVNKRRITEVRVTMTGRAVKKVEAVLNDGFRSLGVSGDAGFSDHRVVIACGFGDFGDGDFIVRNGERAVAANGRVAGILSRHQGTA